MKVLGINDGHNAAACPYEDRRLWIVFQKERLELDGIGEFYGLG